MQYLADQNYKVCIRSEPGACFIGFAADTNHFMLQVSIHFLNGFGSPKAVNFSKLVNRSFYFLYKKKSLFCHQ